MKNSKLKYFVMVLICVNYFAYQDLFYVNSLKFELKHGNYKPRILF